MKQSNEITLEFIHDLLGLRRYNSVLDALGVVSTEVGIKAARATRKDQRLGSYVNGVFNMHWANTWMEKIIIASETLNEEG